MKYKEILQKYRNELDKESIEYLENSSSLKLTWEDIKFWYNNLYIFDLWYNLKNGIKNFWKYKGVIWKDRWYDYSFIIELLKFKLKDNIKNWDKAHYVGSNFTKKRMIVLLNRIEEFEVNLENLQELYYTKKLSKDEFNKLKKELLMLTWYSLGRNIQRFWD
jgi:hypothetical protein